MARIAVEAGHGRHTPGKRSPADEREWLFNNGNVLGFIEEMGKYEGVELRRLDDPTGQRDVPLRERTNIANDWKADLLLSFHHNAIRGTWGSWTGTETYAFNGSYAYTPTELEWARIIHAACLRSYKLRDRGVKRANFHMLRESRMPSVLLEGGFMDSTIDIQVMRQDARLREYGRNVAADVAKQLKLKRKASVQPVTPSSSNDHLYRVQVGAFKNEDNAHAMATRVRRDGFETYIVKDADLIRVQLGAFANEANAEALLKRVKDKGHDAFITNRTTAAIPDSEPINEPRELTLVVNGSFFNDKPTIRRLQNHFGTPETGEITVGGHSLLIEAMQRFYGSPVTGQVTRNGKSALFEAMQRYHGTPVTGEVSRSGSALFKEVQRQLNAGTYPRRGSSNPTPKPIVKGSRVRIKPSAKTYVDAKNTPIPSRIKGNIYTVQDVRGDRVLLKEIVSWVRKSDLERQ